ncbi:patatin-like phospholipase family protein [Pararhodobacter zhoushanensis]|uniref:patatin-like phospholipase family protein n=1 Tax=Pararhodobacter zhoushanensis TaxID=2479545 RepID=UPI000F8CC7B9|nr:patatin-like phospholipase family protein [Pararhodobacter zhoushanensis]
MTQKTRRINLALQGGGAHGAFTWGVLDRLLDEEWLEIAAISGTSAGALNGAAFKSGYGEGGREGARAALRNLWEGVTGFDSVPGSDWLKPFLPGFDYAAKLTEAFMPVSPAEIASQMVSPYDWGPFWRNPLEPMVMALDIDHVQAAAGPRLFVAATNVHDGKVRVFGDAEVTREAILASACLPTVAQAVEIDGQAYWDGGYSANPALHPLYAQDLPDDIVIVSLNPQHRPEVPDSAQEIMNRINEISFNAALLRDLRAIAFVKRLLADGSIKKGAMKDVLVHMIGDEPLMQSLSARSKMAPTPTLLDTLFDAGRVAAGTFLDMHGDCIGERGSVDLVEMFS